MIDIEAGYLRVMKRFPRIMAALAAGSRRAETNEDLAQCEASQSGGEQPQRPTDGGSNVSRY